MNRATLHSLAILIALALVAVFTTQAWAGDDDPPPPKAKWERTWTLTVGDKPKAELKLSGVLSATDVQYVSGHAQPRGKKAVRTVFHEQRNPGGVLKKYRRYDEVRLGKGVMAFAKGEAVRLVGIKHKLAPVVLGGATRHLLHDPAIPQMLDLVARSLSRSTQEVSFPMIDMGTRKARTVVARPGPAEAVADAEGGRKELTVWSLAGLADPITLYVDGKRLVGAKVAGKALLLKGWSWTVAAAPAPAPAPEGGEPAEGETESPSSDTATPPGAAGAVAEEDPGAGP